MSVQLLEPIPATDEARRPTTPLVSESDAIAAAHEAASEIAALAADPTTRGQVPSKQAEILSRSGVTSIAVPRALGGLGASISTIVDTVRIISAADGGVGQLLQIHNVMLRGIVQRPDDALRQRLLSDILAGKRLGHAAAEVGGKSKFDIKTRATRNAQGRWVVNGAKFYATGCYLAEWIVSGAHSDEGAIGFVVHRDTPGLILEDDWDSFGQRHSMSGSVRFENLLLDDTVVTGPSRGGAGVPPRTGLTFPQILHAAIDTGIARGALDAAVHYLRNHARPWVDADVERASEEPLIIKGIGDYTVAVRVAESLLRDAAALFDAYRAAGNPQELEDELILSVVTARAQSDHAALFIGSDMFSLLGASASYRKFNLDRFWADARVHTTHDPIRWRIHHLGNYHLNGVPPDEYVTGFARRAARSVQA